MNLFNNIKISLIDLGLATWWLDKETGRHREQTQLDYFKGNIYFSSATQLMVKSTSRRDDIISLVYILIFLLNRGTLPCLDKLPNENIKDYEELNRRIQFATNAKTATELSDMCTGRAIALERFCKDVAQLKYESTPNYDKLKKMLCELYEGTQPIKLGGIYPPQRCLSTR